MLTDVLTDACLDTGKLIPFLFLTYLLMEYLEEKAGEKTIEAIQRQGRFGPLAGAVAGLLPQCGVSASAASLYAGGILTTGTLLAVFLATSDEMLPIMLSEAAPAALILRILGLKLLIGAVTGFAVDGGLLFLSHLRKNRHEKHIHDLCEQDHCHCEEGNIFMSALRHTIQVVLFIFLVTLLAGLAVSLIGEDTLAAYLSGHPAGGVFLSALIGLIPNCGASVTITELYLQHFLTEGQMLSGLLTGAGVGLLALFRSNRPMAENAVIASVLYGSGVFWGLIFTVLQ